MAKFISWNPSIYLVLRRDADDFKGGAPVGYNGDVLVLLHYHTPESSVLLCTIVLFVILFVNELLSVVKIAAPILKILLLEL